MRTTALIFVVSVLGLAIVGCGDIGNRQVIENTNTLNLVGYAEDGVTPIFVADHAGNFISVGIAPDELLWERGLIRLTSGKVEKVE